MQRGSPVPPSAQEREGERQRLAIRRVRVSPTAAMPPLLRIALCRAPCPHFRFTSRHALPAFRRARKKIERRRDRALESSAKSRARNQRSFGATSIPSPRRGATGGRREGKEASGSRRGAKKVRELSAAQHVAIRSHRHTHQRSESSDFFGSRRQSTQRFSLHRSVLSL